MLINLGFKDKGDRDDGRGIHVKDCAYQSWFQRQR